MGLPRGWRKVAQVAVAGRQGQALAGHPPSFAFRQPPARHGQGAGSRPTVRPPVFPMPDLHRTPGVSPSLMCCMSPEVRHALPGPSVDLQEPLNLAPVEPDLTSGRRARRRLSLRKRKRKPLFKRARTIFVALAMAAAGLVASAA